ncbi:MAG TPA: BON domain-containing protein [Armatimonadota bacterium]|nr:BON domain-containing protein [Armatimonadota bacterium]
MKGCRAVATIVCALVLGSIALAQQRPDADILAELQKRIQPSTLPGGNVTIGVQNGVVTLTGTVQSLAQKLTIINFARRTVGVRDVVDRLTVVPPQKRADDEIAKSVREALSANLSKQEFAAIAIRVQNAVVILTGILPSSYPKQLATTVTSLAPGVVDIRNDIVVRPPQPRTDAEILADVKARYSRNPFVSAATINVTVTGAVVTLTGTVSSFVQAEQAESVARFTPGVIDVRNLLFVSAGVT